MTTPRSTDGVRLSGSWTGEEPGWDEARVERWLGASWRWGSRCGWCGSPRLSALERRGVPGVNVLDRDVAGLTRPLDYQQVCPLLFLWAEKAIVGLLGFREWTLRLVPTAAAVASMFVFRHSRGGC